MKIEMFYKIQTRLLLFLFCKQVVSLYYEITSLQVYFSEATCGQECKN